MLRLSIFVLSALLFSGCGGGEQIRGLDQEQGTTLQSETIDTSDEDASDDKVVTPSKNTDISRPHERVPVD